MRRFLGLSSATAIGAAVVASTLLVVGSVQAQKVYGNYKPPKTEFGHPDISGFWSNVTLTRLTRDRALGDRLVYTEEEVQEIEARVEIEEAEANQPTDPDAPAEFRHETTIVRPEFAAAGGEVGGYNRFWLDPGNRVMRVGGEPRTSILTTPDGQIPRRKDGAAPQRRFGNMSGLRGYVGYEVRSLGERCVIGFGRNGGPPMLANGFYNNNYQIVQTPDHIMILVEMNHDARIIRLNDKQHPPSDIRPYFGDSIGWWEGNTLVVETTNLPQRQAFYGSWENLKVTERFTRVANERLHYSFTVEDSTVWDEPWGGEYEFSTLDGQIYEYACHEGNYALPGILKGLLMEQQDGASR